MSEEYVNQWKAKRLINKLGMAKGAGTSMITLIIPPKDKISRYIKTLVNEYGTASNIKSRVNRLSVLAAITSTQQKLKLYNKVPKNGLAIFCGTIMTDDGKEKKVNIDYVPHKPINTSLYLCDSCFHTEPLEELLESNETYGFIVMDGNGTLYSTLCGNSKRILYKFKVELPNKQKAGGQSAPRFARLRMEARHNYVRKVSELATKYFIDQTTNQPNVNGLILAGSAEFKNVLHQSDLFDKRLKDVVLKTLDISYGLETGLNQAIELSRTVLSNVKLIKEAQILKQFFEEIVKDTGLYCYGIENTLYAMESGAVDTIIVWDNLATIKYNVLCDNKDKVLYSDKEIDANMEIKSTELFIEWLTDNYKNHGCNLNIVSDKSQEGTQFVSGFGGIGAILRYKMEFSLLDEEIYKTNSSDDYSFEW